MPFLAKLKRLCCCCRFLWTLLHQPSCHLWCPWRTLAVFKLSAVCLSTESVVSAIHCSLYTNYSVLHVANGAPTKQKRAKIHIKSTSGKKSEHKRGTLFIMECCRPPIMLLCFVTFLVSVGAFLSHDLNKQSNSCLIFRSHRTQYTKNRIHSSSTTCCVPALLGEHFDFIWIFCWFFLPETTLFMFNVFFIYGAKPRKISSAMTSPISNVTWLMRASSIPFGALIDARYRYSFFKEIENKYTKMLTIHAGAIKLSRN